MKVCLKGCSTRGPSPPEVSRGFRSTSLSGVGRNSIQGQNGRAWVQGRSLGWWLLVLKVSLPWGLHVGLITCHVCQLGLCTASFWDQTWKSSPIWNVILSWLRKKYGGIMRRLIHFCSEVDQAISTHISLTKTKSSLTTLGWEVQPSRNKPDREGLVYLFIGCAGSSWLHKGFLHLWQAGATL